MCSYQEFKKRLNSNQKLLIYQLSETYGKRIVDLMMQQKRINSAINEAYYKQLQYVIDIEH